MSIQPDMEKWKRRFFACLVLATATLFVTGAREVTQDLRHRASPRQQVNADLQDWGRAILTEASPGSTAPAHISPAAARFLVQACSRPAPEKNPQDEGEK